MTSAETLPHLLAILQRAAQNAPSHGIYLFRSGQKVEQQAYPQMYEDAGRIATNLTRQAEINLAERVALVLPNSLEFVQAFFGIIAASGVPVPLPSPPRFTSANRYMQRIRVALERSQIRYILGDQRLANLVDKNPNLLGQDVQVLTVADLKMGQEFLWKVLPPSHPTLVQYTSGSTSLPKGVVLTHHQVLANLEAIVTSINLCSEDIVCSWLPLFHDMGLIGCLLCSIYAGGDLFLMSPSDFVRNPLHWLAPISSSRATVVTAPNSAYSYCIERVSAEDIAALDLSSLRSAMNGAEPVHPTTIRRFVQHFQEAGFRPEAMMPVYGLAEATLMVTCPRLDQHCHSIWVHREKLNERLVEFVTPDHLKAKELVSTGYPVKGIEVCCLDSNGQPTPNKQVGEIYIRGSSVTDCYDFDEATTRSAFYQGWFSTGDLGFVYNGELYVTGRHKDIIIVHGQNYYAHDIELLVNQIEELSVRAVMAISTQREGTEALILLVELRCIPTDTQPIVQKIRETVSASLGITPLDIVFFKQGLLPRTSSGKLERHKGHELYAEFANHRQTLHQVHQ